MLVYTFMYPPTGDSMSDFAQKLQFYARNAVQFGIRSDPFSEVFLGNLSIKVSMHTNQTIIYAYTVVLRRNLRKDTDFMPEMLPIDSCSNPFNLELDPFLSLFL